MIQTAIVPPLMRRPRAVPASRACAAPALAAAVALLAAGGCDLARAGRELPPEGVHAPWRWRPVRMDVSALSTAIPALGERRPTVDARIVFRDDGGDETKAIGVLRVSVRLDGRELASATADLASTEGHARAWDGVTQTYSLRVTLPAEPSAGAGLSIRATFDGGDGSHMDADGDVRWPGRAR
jgi:hypothetical protein